MLVTLIFHNSLATIFITIAKFTAECADARILKIGYDKKFSGLLLGPGMLPNHYGRVVLVVVIIFKKSPKLC